MAAHTREWDSSEQGSPSDENRKTPYEYQQYGADNVNVVDAQQFSDPNDKSHSLRRDLSSRQISMIAIGGAIGTSQCSRVRVKQEQNAN